LEQKKWDLDNDVIISATKVLEQAATEIIAPGSPCIAIIKIHHQDSYRAIAFVFPHLPHQWGSCIKELITDSSCKHQCKIENEY